MKRAVCWILLLMFLVGSGAPVAWASDASCRIPRVVYVPNDPARPTDRYARISRFGNRKRIARLAMPECLDARGGVVVVKDLQGKTRYQVIRRFGNRNRIARLADSTVQVPSGRVVIVRDPVGEAKAQSMRRFGNRNRIEKLVGSSRLDR